MQLAEVFKSHWRAFEIDKTQTIFFGCIGIVHSVLPYLFWEFNFSRHASFQVFTFCSILLSFIVLFIDELPGFCRENIAWVWYLALFYCLPLQGCLMFVSNPADTEWSLYFAASLIILVFLTNAVMYIVLSTLSLVATLIYRSVIIRELPYYLPEKILGIAYVYVITVIISILWSRRIHLEQKEKVAIAYRVAGYLAHELRTVMSFFSSVSIGLENVLSRNVSHIKGLTQFEKKYIRKLPQDIALMCKKTLLLIEILLAKLQWRNLASTYSSITLKDCIERATENLCQDVKTRKLIQINVSNNVTVYGNYIMVQHLFYNLIRNSFDALHGVKNAKITISNITNKKSHIISVKDNGRGLPKEVASKIFREFFTTKQGGIGLGLSFCREIMSDMKGEIKYKSKSGQNTVFYLIFPRYH